METTVLENDKTETTEVEQSNVVQEEVTEKSEAAPEKAAETTEQPAPEKEKVSDEPTVELDGEKIPLSQVKKWKEDVANDSSWKDKNRRESEELNRKRQELAALELLKPMIEQRPDILQQLLSPQPKRDFDKELEQLYLNQPDPNVDPNRWAQWNVMRDRLNTERAASIVQEQAQSRVQQEAVTAHNAEVDALGRKSYVESKKVSDGEWFDMIHWIQANVRADNGRYPKNSYDLAYKALYEDRWLQERTIAAAKRAVAPLAGGKSRSTVSDAGVKQPENQKSASDVEDDAFHDTVKAHSGKNWMPLP